MQTLLITLLICYIVIMVLQTIGAYIDYTDRNVLVSKAKYNDATYRFTASVIQLSLALIALAAVLYF